MVSNECLGDRKLPNLVCQSRFKSVTKWHKSVTKLSHFLAISRRSGGGAEKNLEGCDTLLAQCDTFVPLLKTHKPLSGKAFRAFVPVVPPFLNIFYKIKI